MKKLILIAGAGLLALVSIGSAQAQIAHDDDGWDQGWDSPRRIVREQVIVQEAPVIHERIVVQRAPVIRQCVVYRPAPVIQERVVVRQAPVVRQT